MGVTINKKSTTTEPRLRMDISLSHGGGGGGGLNAFYLYQIFTLDSAVVEVQGMFSSHGGKTINLELYWACLSLKNKLPLILVWLT